VVPIGVAVLIAKFIERRLLSEVGLKRQGILRHSALDFGIAIVVWSLTGAVLMSIVSLGLVPGSPSLDTMTTGSCSLSTSASLVT